MPDNAIHDFGPTVYAFLQRRGFTELRRWEDPNAGVAIDYTNKDLCIRLTFDHYGEQVTLAPRKAIEDRYDTQAVFLYLGLHDADAEVTAAEVFDRVDANYAEIARIFSGRDGRWRSFVKFIEDEMRKRFHYDRITKRPRKQ